MLIYIVSWCLCSPFVPVSSACAVLLFQFLVPVQSFCSSNSIMHFCVNSFPVHVSALHQTVHAFVRQFTVLKCIVHIIQALLQCSWLMRRIRLINFVRTLTTLGMGSFAGHALLKQRVCAM